MQHDATSTPGEQRMQSTIASLSNQIRLPDDKKNVMERMNEEDIHYAHSSSIDYGTKTQGVPVSVDPARIKTKAGCVFLSCRRNGNFTYPYTKTQSVFVSPDVTHAAPVAQRRCDILLFSQSPRHRQSHENVMCFRFPPSSRPSHSKQNDNLVRFAIAPPTDNMKRDG